MALRTKRVSRAGYRLEKVSIRELFERGETLEPSEKALRARAERREGILVFVESIGNTLYYDLMLSVIRVNAGRRCRGPGVQWSDIGQSMRRTSLTNDKLISLLNDGHSVSEVTDLLVEDLSRLLDGR
ncbi:MAG: hypothetical protein ACE5F1_18525 [Planctomycetota bacterium]